MNTDHRIELYRQLDVLEDLEYDQCTEGIRRVPTPIDPVDDPPDPTAPLTGWSLIGALAFAAALGWGLVYVIAQALIRSYEFFRGVI